MGQNTPTLVSVWGRVSGSLRAWFWASRPFTLTASIIPVLVGSALAFREGQASLLLFLLVLIASVLVQGGTNLVDEYADHARPEARHKVPAPYKVISLGLLSAKAVKFGALSCFGIATLIGMYIVAVTGWPILVVSLASLAVAYFYAGGPKPLGTLALGEPLVFIFMGLLMVLGTYFVHTRTITLQALVLSTSVGCIVTAILVANDLRDLEEDREAGKRTPVTLLGRSFGRWLWLLLVTAGFALVLASATVSRQGFLLLLPLLAVPSAVKTQLLIWGSEDRPGLAIAMRHSARLHWWFGLLLAAGVGAGRFQ